MPVLVICENSRRCREVFYHSTKANVACVFRIGPKDNPGTSRLVSLTSVLGKAVGQVLLAHLSGHVEACDWEQLVRIYQW